MKKLFLTSSFADVVSLFVEFEQHLKGKTVTFIPTASTVEKIVFYVNAAKKALEKLGLIVDELDISQASTDEINTKLKNNDFIYVSGGNTFFLLQELKRTGTDQIIINEVNAGKLYIGESAGAIVTSANIEYVSTMDDTNKAPLLKDFNGLNLVPFYIVPHYTNFPFKQIAHKIVETHSSLALSPISDNEALIVTDDQVIHRKN